MTERATFLASLAPTQNAIACHGSGDGLRILLDIPASEMAEAVKVIAWGQKVLRVTIEPETDESRHKSGKAKF